MRVFELRGRAQLALSPRFSSSVGVLQRESDLENLSVEKFDLLSQIHKSGVLLLSACGIVILAVVCQLVDLKTVIHVLGVFSLFLEALDLGGAHREAIRGHTGDRCCCSGLHFYFFY